MQNFFRPLRLLAILLLAMLAPSAAPAANLVPNGGFEVGYSRGWVIWDTGAAVQWGNLEFAPSLLTNDVRSGGGRYSMRMPEGSRMQARTIGELQAGTYAVSFWGKGTASLPFGAINGASLISAENAPNTAVLTGTWTRYTATFTATSNAFYWVRFGSILTGYAQIDDVQLETGGSATTYAPQATVECGISFPSVTNNLHFIGDSPSVTLNYWNTGPATTKQVEVKVYNAWNSNEFSALFTSSTLAAATNTSQVISLPVSNGWHFITTRLTAINDSADEQAFVVLPYTTNTALTQKTWLGTHDPISQYHSRVTHLLRSGGSRSLSPNITGFRWNLLQPVSGSQFLFYDVSVTNWAAEGLDILACLTPEDGRWNTFINGTYNTFSTNLDGSWSRSAWSNYCWLVANRVCNTLSLTNTYFEVGPNEPKQIGPVGSPNSQDAQDGVDYTGTNLPVTTRVATNYAELLSVGVQAITNAYANAKIVGIAGADGDGTWAYKVWTNLSAGTRAAISVVSTHQYPGDFSADPNAGHYQQYLTTHPNTWLEIFRTNNVEVWNTESGTWDTGPTHGMNGMWPICYATYWTDPPFESVRSEWNNRQLVSTARVVNQMLRCVGYGMKRFWRYYGRNFNDSSFAASNPNDYDYFQVPKPDRVATAVAATFVAGGLGPLTNATWFPYLEAYMNTNYAGEPVITFWSAGRTNLTITPTNTFFSVYDCMGNLVQTNGATVIARRLPQYIFGGPMTRTQMSNTFANAIVADAPDILAPNISIDVAPSGLWSGDTARQFIKITAIDPEKTAWTTAGTSTNVVYRIWKDAESVPPWSPSNHTWMVFAAGNHTLYIQAMDASGNVAEKSYDFVPTGATNRIVVTGALTVTGSMTLGQ